MWATQTQGETQTVGWENKPTTDEAIIIMCYGGGIQIIRDLIDDAVTYSMD